jgi:putative membrane protein insertion efficiency factor
MSAISPSQQPITSRLAIKSIHGYRYLLSPWIGNQCRFYPTCSHYAEEAISIYGLTKGSYLTLRRLLKCHPWHPGGLDPVIKPETSGTNSFQQPQDGSR